MRTKVSPCWLASVFWPCPELVVVKESGAIRVRRTTDLVEVASYEGAEVQRLAACATDWLAVSGGDGITILGLPTLTPIHRFHLSREDFEYFTINHVAIDVEHSLLFAADDGGCSEDGVGRETGRGTPMMTVLDVARGRLVTTFGSGVMVARMIFDRWRGRLVVAEFGGTVRLWSADGHVTGAFRPDGTEPDRTPSYRTEYVRALAVTERLIALIQGGLHLWDPVTLERVASISFPRGVHDEWMLASPDGRTILTQDWRDGTIDIRAWRIE